MPVDDGGGIHVLARLFAPTIPFDKFPGRIEQDTNRWQQSHTSCQPCTQGRYSVSQLPVRIAVTLMLPKTSSATMSHQPKHRLTKERLEQAMTIVATHMARHMLECGHSPFTVLFERLERELEQLTAQSQTMDRAQSFLAQRAIRSTQVNRVSMDEPVP